MVTRVAPNGSWVELADHKKRVNHELRARAYFYDQKGFIVSSVSGISESGEPSILAAHTTDSDLGLCFCDHLLEFNPRDATDSYRGSSKLTDWKAFQVSGAKSVKAFEAKS